MRRLRAGFVILIVLALTACGEAESSAESLEFNDASMVEPAMAMATSAPRAVREVVEVEVIKEVQVEVIKEVMVEVERLSSSPSRQSRLPLPRRSRSTPVWSSARSSAPAR